MVYVSYDASNGYFRATDLEAASAGTTPDASETVKGLVELATAAETLTGISTTLALTPGGLAGNKSLAVSGYYKFPGGLIIQWGLSSVSASTSETTLFPVTFPSACRSATAAITEASTTAREALKVVLANNGVQVYNPNAASISFYWFAVGY
jgi:hypothetical protein